MWRRPGRCLPGDQMSCQGGAGDVRAGRLRQAAGRRRPPSSPPYAGCVQWAGCGGGSTPPSLVGGAVRVHRPVVVVQELWLSGPLSAMSP